MVGCILYVIDSLQIPILSLTLLLIMHILFPFLAQIPPLTQLYDPRPFTLAFALTLLFQILSSISKIFSALILSLLPHLAFLPFLLAFFLISWFLPYKSGHLIIFISFFSQLISGLCATSHGIPKITSVLSRLHTFIFIYSTYPL